MQVYRKDPLILVALLKREPWLTQKQIGERLGWVQNVVSCILRELETARRGKGGSTTPYQYAIKLPREKQRAIK